LRALPLERRGDRLELPAGASGAGWSAEGITPEFPLSGHRSMYGATKLAAELLVAEYRALYGMRAIVNRCGVVSGPWQMGKVDQGFVVLWAARHLFGTPLAYQGFGGEGLQVRDVLHVDDLAALVTLQIANMERDDGSVFNVGGGHGRSVSLRELTDACSERAGRSVPISRDVETSRVDVPYYVTDNGGVADATGWSPRRTTNDLLNDVFAWLRAHQRVIEPLLAVHPR
jgi:CDP-paratose 2-epimerase